jgi:hypothetical protein
MVQEKPYRPISGWFPLLLSIGGLIAAPALIIGGGVILERTAGEGGGLVLAIGIVLQILAPIMLFGFMAIAPNQARVLLLFGTYKGSVRTKIVEGAVGMVEMALDHLAEQNIIELDDERRAAMVSNLLVVLCSDRHTQPVVNTGSLYT